MTKENNLRDWGWFGHFAFFLFVTLSFHSAHIGLHFQMSLPGVSDLAKQLVTNWEAAGSLPTTYLDDEEEEEEGELTCLSWLHNSNPHSISTSPVPNIPNLPLPPKVRMKEETGDPMKELLSKKFQIQQKTSVKKLCQHFKILSQVKFLTINETKKL